jgi:hypothetical protein
LLQWRDEVTAIGKEQVALVCEAVHPGLSSDECQQVLLRNPATTAFLAELVGEPMPDWYSDQREQFTRRLGV